MNAAGIPPISLFFSNNSSTGQKCLLAGKLCRGYNKQDFLAAYDKFLYFDLDEKLLDFSQILSHRYMIK